MTMVRAWILIETKKGGEYSELAEQYAMTEWEHDLKAVLLKIANCPDVLPGYAELARINAESQEYIAKALRKAYKV